jgi:hypothetical protein
VIDVSVEVDDDDELDEEDFCNGKDDAVFLT